MMKACLASAFGKPDDVLTVEDGKACKPEPTEKDLLIKVRACSLSPGDYRALLGDKRAFCKPDSWPYIPGGDVSGIVEHVPDAFTNDFHVGQKVIASWDIWGLGGLAEYSLISPTKTALLPDGVSFVEGAALANSSCHAWNAVEKAQIKAGDRVLVIGASGGVGTFVVQLLKKQWEASYVGAVTTDAKLMEELAVVDKVVNYKEENWWEVDEWTKEKFDVVIDCAQGKNAYAKCNPILKGAKEGGRWVAVVLQDWYIDGSSLLNIFFFLFPPLGRQLWNGVRSASPSYQFYIGEATPQVMSKVLDMVAKKELKVIIDPESPHPFTTEGVRAAWNKHIDRAGHGKLVIQISDKN